jgi:hypothetical protein
MRRRDFIINTLECASGAIIIPEILPAGLLKKPAPSDRINIGLIGCGRIAREHNLPEILRYDDARMIAVCDVDSRRLHDGRQMIENYYRDKSGNSYNAGIKMYE